MSCVLVTLGPDDEIDAHPAGPEHVNLDLGVEAQVLVSREQARRLRARLDELL